MSLYRPPPPDYNPQFGQVVGISRLTSGRPVLHVKLRRNYEIRAIVNSDSGYQEALPPIGSQVEVVQASNVWTYIKTLDRGGGAEWTTADAFLVLRQAEAFLGVDETSITIRDGVIVATTSGGTIVMQPSFLNATFSGGGIRLGTRIELNAGWGAEPSGNWHQAGVIPQAQALVTDQQTTLASSRGDTVAASGPGSHQHGMGHTHNFVVDLDPPFKKARVWVDDNLVGAASPPDALDAPTGLSITDNLVAYGSTRTYSWTEVEDAVAYRLKFIHAVYTDPATFNLVLGGATPSPEIGLLSPWVTGTSYEISAVGLERSDRHLVFDGSITFNPNNVDNIRDIAVHGFSVTAIGESPHRQSPASDTHYIYQVELIRGLSELV